MSYLLHLVVRSRQGLHQSSCLTRAAFPTLYKPVHYHHARGGLSLRIYSAEFNKFPIVQYHHY